MQPATPAQALGLGRLVTRVNSGSPLYAIVELSSGQRSLVTEGASVYISSQKWSSASEVGRRHWSLLCVAWTVYPIACATRTA